MTKRCTHGMIPGRCTVQICANWDGYKTDAAASRARDRDRGVIDRLAKVQAPEPGKFRCVGCDKVKKTSEFHEDAHCDRGHQARCKACERARDLGAGGSLGRTG